MRFALELYALQDLPKTNAPHLVQKADEQSADRMRRAVLSYHGIQVRFNME